MAQRFGGKYSPIPGMRGTGGSDPLPVPASQARHRFESRTKWVTIMASPLLMTAFFQGAPIEVATQIGGFGLIAAGMILTREGLQAEAAYDARRVARRPAVPRKLFGGIMAGLGVAVGAFEPGAAAAGAGILGFTGAVLHWLSFGPDPTKDKGMEGVDTFQQDRVARVITDAEGYLAGITDAIRRTGDRQLEARVNLFSVTARMLFDQVEQDPVSLSSARRYLCVYLMGARDATVKFADLYAQTRDRRARDDYEALLTDLERNFRALADRLRQGDRTNMDIEISVLRDRLAREGVRLPAEQPLIGRQPATQTMDDLLRMPERAAADGTMPNGATTTRAADQKGGR